MKQTSLLFNSNTYKKDFKNINILFDKLYNTFMIKMILVHFLK